MFAKGCFKPSALPRVIYNFVFALKIILPLLFKFFKLFCEKPSALPKVMYNFLFALKMQKAIFIMQLGKSPSFA